MAAKTIGVPGCAKTKFPDEAMTALATSRASQAELGRAWLVWLVWSGLVVDEGALLQDQMRRAGEMRRLLSSADRLGVLAELRSRTRVVAITACDNHRGCGQPVFCAEMA